VLSFTAVARHPDFTVAEVGCGHDGRGWSGLEAPDNYRVVLVRRGRFRRRVAGVPTEVDSTLAYVGTPGEEEYFAHPAGGDVCTLVSLTPVLWRQLAGDSAKVTRPTVYVDPALDLSHRRVLAAARAGDVDYAVTEGLMSLLGRVFTQVRAGPADARAEPTAADRAVVLAARRAIDDDDPAAGGLFPLAELLGVSPYRLSRAFTRELGVSLTRYRNRVRIGRALDRLEGGEPSLAVLAADLGFADQAHLSRTMTEHLGHPPTALRRLLTPARTS
jgi:AraC-like DNA-binding protein